MKTIRVNISQGYEVHIGAGGLEMLGDLAAGKVAVISDKHVWPIYGPQVRRILESTGFPVVSYIISPGENSKNPENFLDILNFLSENKVTRSDCLLALGGGVVGDLAGFAAACYMRGIPCIQLPTSLLAMVDASVGGKTAINLKAGKNLCGVFHQPRAVICDTDTLATLPEENFVEGCDEIIKYGILYDPALFAYLEEKGRDFDREAVIARCVKLKRDAVEADEFDLGARRLLNLGHTIGHAIEAENGYRISHGQAVAIGIAMVTRAAVKMDICPVDHGNRILSLVQKFQLPTNTRIAPEALWAHALGDKKARGDQIPLIIPKTIGHCDILPLDAAGLLNFIKAGL